MMLTSNPIRLAILGTGLFARQAHLPAIQSLGDAFEIVAVYNHRTSTTADLVALLPHPVEVYDDLAALLARDDIEAVDLVQPIEVMPDVIEQALTAGKHVISEKPAAPDLATGRRLLSLYAQHRHLIWMVAENWRYEPAFHQAAEIVQSGVLGQPQVCDWAIYANMQPTSNQYYHTAWRRTGTFPGGFLLDGGVHNVAALRQILGEIQSVNALTAQFRPDLPPTDTLSAALQFDSGAVGTWTQTFASSSPWPTRLRILCERGAISVRADVLEVVYPDRTEEFAFDSQGVKNELAAFAAAIRDGAPHANSPEQAMQDVAVIEAILLSSTTGQRITVERFV
ncbi:MAG TPA: Gfo/Idh/MocA family oxidoreductase [Aggregatilineaceae bacterium]|nr:Gfo/Idh/MocA family oxidoreductase [Aggregatilineaceae bacterium]